MHALVEVEKNDRRFSIQHDTYNEVIPGMFDRFGCEVLEKSLKYPSRILVLDEIGILEKDEPTYLESVKTKLFIPMKSVIGVLEKEGSRPQCLDVDGSGDPDSGFGRDFV